MGERGLIDEQDPCFYAHRTRHSGGPGATFPNLLEFAPPQMKDCHRDSTRSGKHTGEVPGEPAIRTVVEGDKQAVDIGNECSRLERFALKADTLVGTQRQPRESPAQGRRHRHRGDHRHGDDHGKEILGERAHGQADRRDNHLGRAAGVHTATERQAFSCAQAAQSAPDERSGELAKARDQNQADG